MRGRRSIVCAMLGAVLVAAALASSAAAGGGDRKKPSRVLIIMLDQARPDTIERYGMENVKELMRRGASFPNKWGFASRDRPAAASKPRRRPPSRGGPRSASGRPPRWGMTTSVSSRSTFPAWHPATSRASAPWLASSTV